MGDTVDVTIPVEPEAVAALWDARNRAAIGRPVSRVLQPRPDDDPLVGAIAAPRLRGETGASISRAATLCIAAGLVPASYAFACCQQQSRGWPGQARP